MAVVGAEDGMLTELEELKSSFIQTIDRHSVMLLMAKHNGELDAILN